MPQQQQPRRILEKSRTVRRRYQRSNKRFEFSASQIQRIEREEEREKKAKQLREREKKKLANKKKRAEKEAKEREERRRLGIPEPNTSKIPASQPLLLNFFGAGRKKVDDVKEPTEEETEESEASEEEDSNEVEDERKQQSLSPVQEEEPDVMQQQDLQEPCKTDDTANCISEDFSDLETELGDDWLDDPELGKHMASIENTQQSLSSSAAIHKDDQPTEPAQSATSNWAGMTESFEDDTSLMLQALDPTVLDEFETPQQPKAGLHEVKKLAASDAIRMSQHSAVPSPSGSKYVASNFRTGNAQDESHRVNSLTPTNFRSASPATKRHQSARQLPHGIQPQGQQMVPKQQLRTTTSVNVMIPSIHKTPTGGTFKKPMVVASMQPKRLHFSPEKSFNQSTKTNQFQKAYSQPHFDAEDEFGDLPLSTQDVRDLDCMVGLG